MSHRGGEPSVAVVKSGHYECMGEGLGGKYVGVGCCCCCCCCCPCRL